MISLFLDGAAQASASLVGYEALVVPVRDHEFVLRLGAAAGGNRFRGLVNEVTMFRRDLSADEVKRLMVLTTGG